MGRASRRLIAACVIGGAAAAALAGCALGSLNTPASSEQRDAGSVAAAPAPSSPADALLAQSRAARTSGDAARAVAAIERAVRIAPNDPQLWLEYGRVQLALGDFEQAMALARRASSLAGSDTETRTAASQLIADANRERARAAAAAEREAQLH